MFGAVLVSPPAASASSNEEIPQGAPWYEVRSASHTKIGTDYGDLIRVGSRAPGTGSAFMHGFTQGSSLSFSGSVMGKIAPFLKLKELGITVGGSINFDQSVTYRETHSFSGDGTKCDSDEVTHFLVWPEMDVLRVEFDLIEVQVHGGAAGVGFSRTNLGRHQGIVRVANGKIHTDTYCTPSRGDQFKDDGEDKSENEGQSGGGEGDSDSKEDGNSESGGSSGSSGTIQFTCGNEPPVTITVAQLDLYIEECLSSGEEHQLA